MQDSILRTLSVSETKFLKTIELEEQFGGKTYQASKAKEDKKKAKESKAAIGFVYEDSTGGPTGFGGANTGRPVPDNLRATASNPSFNDPAKDEVTKDGEDSDSDLDLDMTVDIMALGVDARKDINKVGKDGFCLGKEDFMAYFAKDIEEQAEIKAAKQLEEEKAQHSVSFSSFTIVLETVVSYIFHAFAGSQVEARTSGNARPSINGTKTGPAKVAIKRNFSVFPQT